METSGSAASQMPPDDPSDKPSEGSSAPQYPVLVIPQPGDRTPERWRPRVPARIAWIAILSIATGLGVYLRWDGRTLKQVVRPETIPNQSDGHTEAGSGIVGLDATSQGMSRSELQTRLAQAIEKTSGKKVVYEDVLGEGEGSWDSHARYPRDEVNCIVWIDLVLAETYGKDIQDKTPIMDRLRYYEGVPAYGMRKHYNLHRVQLDALPLRPIQPESCGPAAHASAELNPEAFAKTQKYTCPLYRSELSKFDFDFLPPGQLTECAPHLEPGYYVMFGVETAHYSKVYGQNSGPMGLVHGMFLEVTWSGQTFVHHASTSAGKIKKEKLEKYVARMSRELHRGYTLYELDPTWTPPTMPVTPESISPEAQRILACEKALPAKRTKQSAFSKRKIAD